MAIDHSDNYKTVLKETRMFQLIRQVLCAKRALVDDGKALLDCANSIIDDENEPESVKTVATTVKNFITDTKVTDFLDHIESAIE